MDVLDSVFGLDRDEGMVDDGWSVEVLVRVFTVCVDSRLGRVMRILCGRGVARDIFSSLAFCRLNAGLDISGTLRF